MVRCTWDRTDDQAAEQTAHPAAVRAGGRVFNSHRCTHIDEEPNGRAHRSLPQGRLLLTTLARSTPISVTGLKPNADDLMMERAYAFGPIVSNPKAVF